MYKNFLFLFCLLLGLIARAVGQEESNHPPRLTIYTPHNPPKFLDPTQRPKELSRAVDDSFSEVKKNSNISSYIDTSWSPHNHQVKLWGLYNGQNSYYPLGIQETNLIRAYVLRGHERGQRKFAFMDVGAGDFSWGSYGGVVHTLIREELFDLEDTTFTLIGVRGEPIIYRRDSFKAMSSTEELTIQLADSKVFKGPTIERINRGKFRAEDFAAEMGEHGLSQYVGKLDFVISHWGITHFTDPLGTIVQIYDTLQDGGMLFTTSFLALSCMEYKLKNTKELFNHIKFTQRFYGIISPSVFSLGNTPALVAGNADGARQEWLLLLKRGDKAKLPISYYGNYSLDNSKLSASKTMQIFKVNEDAPSPGTVVPSLFAAGQHSRRAGVYYNMPPEDRSFLNQFGNLYERREIEISTQLSIEKFTQPLLRLFLLRQFREHFDSLYGTEEKQIGLYLPREKFAETLFLLFLKKQQGI